MHLQVCTDAKNTYGRGMIRKGGQKRTDVLERWFYSCRRRLQTAVCCRRFIIRTV